MDELDAKDGCCIVLVVALIIVGCLAWHWYPSSNEEGDLHEYALLGSIQVIRVDTLEYELRYKSVIDKIDTKANIKGAFELGQVKTIVDAAVNKEFENIKSQKDCLVHLITIAREANVGTEVTCKIYGNHEIALKVYDRDLWVDDLIEAHTINKKLLANLVKR
jgi:hypothetical protein